MIGASRSRFEARAVAAALVLVALSWVPRAGADMDPAEKARRAQIVAHVGPREVTLGELEDRLAAVPRFQLATFGPDAATIRKNFLAGVIVPEVLLSLGAEARKLDQDPRVAAELQRARANAAKRAIRASVPPAEAIPKEDLEAYYAANKAKYESVDRYSVFRILCKTREEANAVLAEAKKTPTVDNFGRLAREHSTDRATFLRGGNLGFVTIDGVSNEVGLNVDPAVVHAASMVKDGEFVAQPVEEQGQYAVVWHRGTVRGQKHTFDEIAPALREVVHREKVEGAEKKAIDDLRAANVKDLDADLLNTIDISLSDGMVVPRKRPGQVPPINAPSPRQGP